MKIEGPAKALLVMVGESDHWHGKPLYAAIVERAKSLGLAGATVQRGIMGFGANSRIHTASVLRLSEDLPVSILVIDVPDRIKLMVDALDEMVSEGVVATWDVTVEFYRSNPKPN